MQIFKGTNFDIYTHWLILLLGIGVLVFGAAVYFSCRSFAIFVKIPWTKNSFLMRFYTRFYRYHSYYWNIFWIILILHLMVAITHIGIPNPLAPFYQAQQIAFYSSILNFVFVVVVLFSCRSISALFSFFGGGNLMSANAYKRFYKYHSYGWMVLAISVGTHIVSGLIHAINT
jgi:hypothetical protein